MNIKELNDLINVRSYVINAANNGYLDRNTSTYMTHILLLIDKKINSLLMSDDFKDYIDFKDLEKVRQEVREASNIKSSLKK